MATQTQTPAPAVDSIEVRRANLDDIAMLALVGAATFLDGFAEQLPGEAILAHIARHHLPEAYASYLARPEVAAWLAVAPLGGGVGYALLTPPELPEIAIDAKDLELKRIYTLSRTHGTGLGQRLMGVAIEEARSRGAHRLLLGVHSGNARALRFYARNHFHPVGTRQFQVGPVLCDDYILARVLLPT